MTTDNTTTDTDKPKRVRAAIAILDNRVLTLTSGPADKRVTRTFRAVTGRDGMNLLAQQLPSGQWMFVGKGLEPLGSQRRACVCRSKAAEDVARVVRREHSRAMAAAQYVNQKNAALQSAREFWGAQADQQDAAAEADRRQALMACAAAGGLRVFNVKAQTTQTAAC